MPNTASQETPMIDLFMATLFNSRERLTLLHPNALAKFITVQSFNNIMSQGMQRMIGIEKYEDSINLGISYEPDYIAKIKTVNGYRCYPDKKCWSVPYSELKNLFTVFDGKKVEIDSSLEFGGKDEKND